MEFINLVDCDMKSSMEQNLCHDLLQLHNNCNYKKKEESAVEEEPVTVLLRLLDWNGKMNGRRENKEDIYIYIVQLP